MRRRNLIIPRQRKQKLNRILSRTIREVNRNNYYKANRLLNYAKSITPSKKRGKV